MDKGKNDWKKRWKKFVKWLKNNLFKVLTVPTVISFLTFALTLTNALKDGVITQDEFSHIMRSTSGLESVILLAAMLIFGKK